MSHERALYDRVQHDFPLVERPYAQVGAALSYDEREIIELFARDLEAGRISRIGAVFAPNVIGASTLAALAAPAARLDTVAEQVSAYPEVSHNYARDGHHYNLWFVVGARDHEALAAVLAAITVETGLPVLDLPLAREFHIDLGFALSASAARPRRRDLAKKPARQTLDDTEWRLVAALEDGLQLTPRPYHALADYCGLTYDDVIARLAQWQRDGVIRRFGVVLQHRRFGFTHNAMCVWNIPDAEVDALGARLAELAPVNLCYRRTRSLPDWPYNLFAMVHARDAAALGQALALFDQQVGAPDVVLRSLACFKQCGTRYAGAAMVPA